MKTLANKSEITAKNLKENDCDYKGKKLGFDKESNVYFIGSWFNNPRTEFETIKDLKYSI